MNKKQIRKLAYGGVFTGLILVATMFLQIPTGLGGYVNLGDGVIFASAIFLGPFAGICGALGAGVADLLLSYGLYAPATFIIKGIMGLFAGLMLHQKTHEKQGKKDSWARAYIFTTLVFLIAEVIMVAGYFVFEWFVLGLDVALPSILPNVVQGVAGIAVGLALMPVMKKVMENEYYGT